MQRLLHQIFAECAPSRSDFCGPDSFGFDSFGLEPLVFDSPVPGSVGPGALAFTSSKSNTSITNYSAMNSFAIQSSGTRLFGTQSSGTRFFGTQASATQASGTMYAESDSAHANHAIRKGASKLFTCGIINAKSGRCAENCSFCAQSSHYSTKASVYPLLDITTLYKHAEALASHGVTYMGIVTSGTSPNETDFEHLCKAASLISSKLPIRLCASLGLLSLEKAIILKQAGFTSYHHNLETAASYYPTICTTHSFETRLATIRNALKSGLRVCAGGIFGLGETWEQRVELAHCLATLGVNSIPINFLMPIAGTPMENAPLLSPREALNIIALFRHMNPTKDIVLCGGSSQALRHWKPLFYQAGANGLMVGDYLTAKGSNFADDMRLIQALQKSQN